MTPAANGTRTDTAGPVSYGLGTPLGVFGRQAR